MYPSKSSNVISLSKLKTENASFEMLVTIKTWPMLFKNLVTIIIYPVGGWTSRNLSRPHHLTFKKSER